MLQQHLDDLNVFLRDPASGCVFDIFDRNGYLRLNMLYVSPVALGHFWRKLAQYGLERWYFRENELVFELAEHTVRFRGLLSVYVDGKIFCVELDFDPVVSNSQCLEFLRDVEMFLKKCDSCFFMSCPVDIDSEVLSGQVGRSVEFLLGRK